MDKQTLIKNFSKYAYAYDKYADVQNTAAFELISQIRENGFKSILEIGCGTGNYTAILRQKFKIAKIKAVDISGKMIEIARNKVKDAEFIIADAENLDMDGKFDLITSNACFQWFEDLPKALAQYKTMLDRGGAIHFSIFGPLTFHELNASLAAVSRDASLEAPGFIIQDRIKHVLKNNFKKVSIKEKKYEETFLNLKGLLNKIKYTGVRGSGFNGKAYFGKKFIERLEKAYLDKFGKISATYQVFFCHI